MTFLDTGTRLGSFVTGVAQEGQIDSIRGCLPEGRDTTRESCSSKPTLTPTVS